MVKKNDIKSIKLTIEALLRETERKGIEQLLEYMDKNGFYTAPCSTKYHLNVPGGLAKHSFNVWAYAQGLSETLLDSEECCDITDNITIVSFLHDLGKMGQFGKEQYVPNGDKKAPYLYNSELLPVDHEIRSIAIASRFIELTEEEQFAILYHNGLYTPVGAKNLQGHETKLQMILHFADMWASRVVDEDESV